MELIGKFLIFAAEIQQTQVSTPIIRRHVMTKRLLSLQSLTRIVIFLATTLLTPTVAWAEDFLTDNFGKNWYDGNGNQITSSDITIPGNGMVELFSDGRGYLIQEDQTRFQKMDAFEISWVQTIREVTISLSQYDENKQNYNDFGVLSIDQNRGYIDNLNTTLTNSQRLKLTLTNNNDTEVTLTISSINIIESYGIFIGETEATNLNALNILEGTENDGKVSFDADNSTLTLNGVNLNEAISSSMENLIVHLIGSNTIDSGSDTAPFHYNGELESPTLSFESEEAEEGELTMRGALYNDDDSDYTLLKMNYGYIATNKFDNGSGSDFSGDWVIDYPEEGFHIYRNVHYNLMVGEYMVNKANKSSISSGYPTYDDKTNTLQLTESYSGLVVKSGMKNLTLSISGKYCSLNQITFESMDDTTTSGTLTIKKAEGDADFNTLSINNDEGAIIGFSNVTVQSPLKLAIPTSSPTTWDAATTEVIISDEDFYNLKIAGVWVSSSNKDNVLEMVAADMPTVTFDETNNTLCLQQAMIGMEKPYNGNAIESGLENLTVKISSFSTIQSTKQSFKALNESAKITFDVEGDGSFLYLGQGGIEGFAQKTFNHGLCYVYDSDSQGYLIRYMSPPTMSGYYDTITLEKNDSSYYRGCKIYYSIAYKNEANNVTGAEYSEPFYMEEPGIVTAWLSAGENNGVTKTVTGKLFGYPEYYVAPDEVLTPEIYPAIDGITVTQTFTTEDTDAIAINDNSITGIDEGWAQVNVTLLTENPDFEILNNYNIERDCYETYFYINVGARLSTIFKDDNEYATYINNGPEVAFMVPEGMKAYVVSGISNDGEQLTYKEVSVIPPSYFFEEIPGASPAILLEKGTAKAFFNIPQEKEMGDETIADFKPNLLKYVEPGNPITVTESNKYYILYNDMFVKATKGTQIGSENPDGKWACYLDLTGTNARTRGFNIGTGDGSTNIDDAIVDTTESQSNTWHDLQGRRITKPAKTGLYIINGKKVVVNNK